MKMTRPRKPRNYCSTVDDILKEKHDKELVRREHISEGMKAYRATERLLESSCMSTEQMRKLAQMEEVMWLIFGELKEK